MIVSLLYRLTRMLLSVPAVVLHRDGSKDTELLALRHENAVFRRQINGQIRHTAAPPVRLRRPPQIDRAPNERQHRSKTSSATGQ